MIKPLPLLKFLNGTHRNLEICLRSDAVAEGFENKAEYYLYLMYINKASLKKMGITPLDGPNNLHITKAFLDLEPTVYEFEITLKKMDNDFNGKQVFVGKEITLEMFKKITGAD